MLIAVLKKITVSFIIIFGKLLFLTGQREIRLGGAGIFPDVAREGSIHVTHAYMEDLSSGNIRPHEQLRELHSCR